MHNGTQKLEELFKLNSFRVPQYQRAYAWMEPQLSAFISDLRQQANAQSEVPDKNYYMGTFLLHSDSGRVNVVDGQQRLTTSVIFIAAALKRHNDSGVLNQTTIKPEVLRRNFIHDRDEDIQKFCTIDEDNFYFRQHILGLDEVVLTENSPSSRRLKYAMEYFLKNVNDSEWGFLLGALTNANIMVYSVQNHGDATLIFELQNDRGKKLTDLEALKSYLMHLIYLNSKNHDEVLKGIQGQFSIIYREIERQSNKKRIPQEDAILSYHCAAYLNWTEDGWRHPKELVKATLKLLPQDQIQSWITGFVSGLQETYKAFSDLDSDLDQYEAFAQLILLNRMASFWPVIIKTYRLDKSTDKKNFQLACRLMEVYAMRGYGMSNLRSDAGMSSLYNQARDFKSNFEELHNTLHSMSSWYELDSRFKNSLDRASLYKSNRPDVQYLLWRYENMLRGQSGKNAAFLSWKEYLEPRNDGSRLSIEHIAARENAISLQDVEWIPGETKKFIDVATDRLGNLVLDFKSPNSSKGKSDFIKKLKSLSRDSTLLSQGELLKWAIQGEHGTFDWDIRSVKSRHEELKAFALKTWDPNTYFTASVKEEEPLMDMNQCDNSIED